MIDFKKYTDEHLVVELGGGPEETQQPVLNKLKKYFNLDRVAEFCNPKGFIYDFDDEYFSGFCFKDNEVDLVYASHCMEHVKDIQRLLNECHRLLKPDGKLVVVVPEFHGEKAYAIDHVRLYSKFTFESLTRPEYIKYGWAPWKIDDIVVNKRPDIHVVMTPEK